ncbi:MAG TPA: hypothetical protein VFZ29_08705 [Solirubrobacterales bacterium]
MSTPMCEPLETAQSSPLLKSGVAITNLEGLRESVFEKLSFPEARFVRLRQNEEVYEAWRGQLTLAPKFRARAKVWPVRTSLQTGLALGPDVGLPKWEAERALEGLIQGEAYYVERATHVLEDHDGFSLELPGDVTVVVVAEKGFRTAVEVDDPVHLSGPPVLL